MKYSKDIKDSIKNIDYYAKQLHKFASLQMDEDSKTQIYLIPATIRFASIGNIDIAAEWIELYCSNLEANLKTAEDQEKDLHKNVSEEELNEQLAKEEINN